ncbi:DnaD domain-containing protein [Bacillus sp. 2205SS5-2]|uniref:DnaD domain-containing protein n=1 Tax=Bacillus sp. 2205SS5-2 TaxID=3109031 RepID=UPI003005BA76
MDYKQLLLTWLEKGSIQLPNMLLSHYSKMNIAETELVLLIQILSYQQKGIRFPTPEQLASTMTISSEHSSSILRQLLQKGLLTIEEGTSPEGIRYEQYSLQSLWEKMISTLELEEKSSNLQQNLMDEGDLYKAFEQEFGRPLSPIEVETLSMWIDQDHQNTTIIKAALKEAVISGKVNFRYIDRILFEWKKSGVNTIEQARAHSERFRQKQPQREKKEIPRNKSVPFYNWLEQ